MSIAWANRLGAGALAAVLALGANVVVPTPAAAQSFFESLFGGFGGRYERRRPVTAPAYASPSYDERDPDGRFPDYHPRRQGAEAGIRGGGTNCVRLCDGRCQFAQQCTASAEIHISLGVSAQRTRGPRARR